MSVTVSITQDDIFGALRTVLLAISPATTTDSAGDTVPFEVIQAQANRVPEPAGEDFILMTPTNRVRLATNEDNYTDAYPNAYRFITEPTQVTIQLDIHGPRGSEVAQIVTSVFRDSYGVDQMQAVNAAITPLYADDPRQMPFVNAEQQYEDRWTLNVVLQVNPVLAISQDFASALDIGLRPVEVYYPDQPSSLNLIAGGAVRFASGGNVVLAG